MSSCNLALRVFSTVNAIQQRTGGACYSTYQLGQERVRRLTMNNTTEGRALQCRWPRGRALWEAVCQRSEIAEQAIVRRHGCQFPARAAATVRSGAALCGAIP